MAHRATLAAYGSNWTCQEADKVPVAGRATGSDHLSALGAIGVQGGGLVRAKGRWGLGLHPFPAPSGAATTISPRLDQVVPAVGLRVTVTQEEAVLKSHPQLPLNYFLRNTVTTYLLYHSYFVKRPDQSFSDIFRKIKMVFFTISLK